MSRYFTALNSAAVSLKLSANFTKLQIRFFALMVDLMTLSCFDSLKPTASQFSLTPWRLFMWKTRNKGAKWELHTTQSSGLYSVTPGEKVWQTSNTPSDGQLGKSLSPIVKANSWPNVSATHLVLWLESCPHDWILYDSMTMYSLCLFCRWYCSLCYTFMCEL